MKAHRWIAAAWLGLSTAVSSAAPAVNSSAWWNATVSTLQAGSPSEQQSARAELIHVGEMTSMPPGYPASLNAALLPVLNSGGTRAKLNAAVVLERVASKTASPALLPATSALLSDRSEAIVLWGIKTARPLIAAGGATAANLAPKVVSAINAHLDSVPIAQESYAALTPEGPPQPVVVQSLLAVLEARTALYVNGAAPPEPAAEKPIPAYLSVTCWAGADPTTQKRILTGLGNLACAAACAVANGNTDRTVLAIARLAANAVGTIGAELHDEALIASAKALEDIHPEDMGPVLARVAELETALRARGILVGPRR